MIRTLAVLVGLAAAGLVIGWARRRAPAETKLWRDVLIVMQVIYLLFAAVARQPTGALREAVVLTLFTAIAVAGTRYSAWFLALGLFAHGAWDLRHLLLPEGYVVAFYPEACIGFDGLVFLYVLTRARGWDRARRAGSRGGRA